MQLIGQFYINKKNFSPAIPPSKGIPVGAQPVQATEAIELPPQASASSGGGLFGWVKGAVSSGGILSKVAERAKNSVDSMITTLDPQMREFICKFNYIIIEPIK